MTDLLISAAAMLLLIGVVTGLATNRGGVAFLAICSASSIAVVTVVYLGLRALFT